MDPHNREGYGVAYPWIDAGDIWVEAKTNDRFVIKQVITMAEMASKPLLFGFAMAKLPDSSPEMDIAMYGTEEGFDNETNTCPSVSADIPPSFPDTGDMIKSDAANADTHGWRRGLFDEA
jgi:hypothetical protein